MVNIFTQFAATETAEKSGIAVLGINPVSLLLQLATFLILYLLIKRFAFKAIVKMLEQRRKVINDGIGLGQKMEAEQAKLEKEIDKALHKARNEADKIVANAHSESVEIIKAAEETAAHKSAAMIEDAKAQIATATEKAKQELKAEMVELVAEATGALIGEKVDARKDSSLIAKALEEVKK